MDGPRGEHLMEPTLPGGASTERDASIQDLPDLTASRVPPPRRIAGAEVRPGETFHRPGNTRGPLTLVKRLTPRQQRRIDHYVADCQAYVYHGQPPV